MRITQKNLRRIIRETLEEVKNTCWDGYSPGAQTGKKTKIGKSGKRVANCEKINEEDKERLEEALLYHIESGAGVDKNIFRPGSTTFFALFREARSRYLEGKYKPQSLEEFELLEDLEIGEFAIYEGKLVPQGTFSKIFAPGIAFSLWFCRHRRENLRAPGVVLRKPSVTTHFSKIAILALMSFGGRFSVRRSGESHFCIFLRFPQGPGGKA